MKKLLDGIRDFHTHLRPAYRERFAHLALGQSPDCLFVACADSRVVPNLFASTDPGDLFVLRNVGNMVPPASADDLLDEDVSAGAAVEFATRKLQVRDIVVCGHSSCGAMHALLAPERPDRAPHLERWLQYARPSIERLRAEEGLAPSRPPVDRLSQAHVLQQIENLRSYPVVAERLAEDNLTLHAWWFDLANAEVLAFDVPSGGFVPLVELIER